MNIDNKTSLRLQLLVRDAELAAFAFYRDSTDEIMLVPAGLLELNPEVSERMERGFRMVAVVALMRNTQDSNARIGYEPMPGVSEEALQKAKAVFQDQLAERGIIRPLTPEV